MACRVSAFLLFNNDGLLPGKCFVDDCICCGSCIFKQKNSLLIDWSIGHSDDSILKLTAFADQLPLFQFDKFQLENRKFFVSILCKRNDLFLVFILVRYEAPRDERRRDETNYRKWIQPENQPLGKRFLVDSFRPRLWTTVWPTHTYSNAFSVLVSLLCCRSNVNYSKTHSNGLSQTVDFQFDFIFVWNHPVWIRPKISVELENDTVIPWQWQQQHE